MQSTAIFRRLAAILPALVLLGALGVSLYDPRGTATLVADRTFDIFQQIKPRPSGAQKSVYIDIGAASAARYGSWPWPRARLAELVEAARKAGAKTILLDMPLPEADATSPREALKMWSDLPSGTNITSLAAALSNLPDHDILLSEALREGPSVVTFVPGKGAPASVPEMTATIAEEGGNPLRYAPAYDHWAPTLGRLVRGAEGLGIGLPSQRQSDRVRSLPMLANLDGDLVPSTALEALRVDQGASVYRTHVAIPEGAFAVGKPAGIDRLVLEGSDILARTDAKGALRLYFRSRSQQSTYPAWQILEDASALDFAGKIAVIGFSVNGAEKTYDTVVGPLPSGAIVTEAIDQIASATFLVRPPWAPSVEQAFILLAGVILIVLIVRTRAAWGFVFMATVLGGLSYGAWYLFDTEGWLLDPALPALSLAGIFVTTAIVNRFRIEAETRFIENQMTRRLSTSALNKIIRNPKLLPEQGELRDVTSLAVGLRGFNVIADRYLEDPIAYTDILNRFFSPLTKTVHDRGGMVDRYTGDTMMAIWNAPLNEPDHAMKACDAALRMREQLDSLNEFLEEDAKRHNLSHIPLSVSIGVESGPAISGNMGSVQRYDYGVLGEPVSIAHYLRHHAINYGPAVIVGDGFKKAVGDRFALLEVDLVSTPRHPNGWRAYALLGDSIVRASPKFRALEDGHRQLFEAYRNQRWAAAREALAHCRGLNGSISTLYDFYEGRIKQLENDPPGPNWNGSYYAGRF
ncbi:MAG: adenylate/guanylate cyclase domain-containing protein [Parvibaculaceae bacterium]